MSGPGTLYIAEYGESYPATTGSSLTWGGTWSDVGYTVDGVTVEASNEFYAVEVDQEVAPIRHVLTKTGARVMVGMAETDANHLLWSIANTTLTLTPPAVGQVGLDKLGIGGAEFTVWSLGFETVAPGSPVNTPYWRMIQVWRAIAGGAASLPFKKGATTLVNVEFFVQADSSKAATERIYKIIDMTAVASS
jgi:hypothetical protein